MINYHQELCQFFESPEVSKYNIENKEQMISFISKSDYFAKLNKLDLASFSDALRRIAADLDAGKPIQYCLGEAYFMDLVLHVDERVLIPRPETEELCWWAQQELENSSSGRILEIGTGSGAIIIHLAKLFPDRYFKAVDVSAEALDVARMNASKYGVKVDFVCLDFLKDSELIDEKWDLIISNPPYVSFEDQAYIPQSVFNYEPHRALFAEGEDPDVFYKHIGHYGKSHLNNKGSVFCEINEFRGEHILNIFKQLNYSSIDLKRDLQGKDRMLKIKL